ncbi:MAG TPA: hypothetical protein VM915_16675, partial [Verrucomicrobiae bacterium]|nr:hypothetical protein [Verrucomicrobiae bacterium]
MCEHHAAEAEPKLVDVTKMDRRLLLRGLATGTLVLATGCATNAETGRSQLILIDEAQLQQAS